MKRVQAASVLVVMLGLAMPLLADKASIAYKVGVAAETHNRADAAYEAYRSAYAVKPNDARYAAAYTRMRFRAAAEHVHKGEVLLEAGNLPLALAEFLRATEIDPSNDMAQQEARRTRELIDRAAAKGQIEAPEDPLAEMASRLKGPVVLQPLSNDPITLNMTESSNVIYKTVAKLAGLNIIFDPDYTPKKLSIELNSVGLSDALQILARATKTFWRPLTPNTIYVASENAGKRKEAEQSVMKTFYLTNTSSATELTETANAMRTMLEIAQVQPIPARNALLVRATPDQLVLAEKLLSDIDKPKGEVVMDVAILEVTRDRLRTLGTNPPTSASVTISPNGVTPTATSGTNTGTSGTSGSLTLNSLAHLNATNFMVSIPSASFTALMTDSNTKIIQNPQMRVLDNQKATLKIGDRVPIATGSFSPGVGAVGISALVNTQFQYLDVGVSVDITPHIHSRREVSLKVGMEISSVTGQQNIGGVTQPIIGQRRIEHETRLLEGEVNLLGGFQEDTQSDSMSGYPWLSKIPIMRYLFGQNQTDHNRREIVFAITPHIIRAQNVTAENLRAIAVGSPGSIELQYNEAPKTSAPVTPPAPVKPATPKAPAAPVIPATPPPAGLQPQIPLPAPAQPTTQQPGPTQPTPMGIPTGEQRREPQITAAQPANHASGSTPNALPSIPTPPTMPAGNTKLIFEPGRMSQPVGSTFKVYVSVTGAQNVFSIPLEISYDPRSLEILDVANGGFLSPDRQSVALVYRADTVKGTLQITGTRPPNTGGISGSGAVFVITVSAKSAGESVMAITGPTVLDPSLHAAPAIGSNVLIHIVGNEVPRENRNPDQEKQYPDIKRTADLRDKSTPSMVVQSEPPSASAATSR